jgi:hypothetical protein
MLLDDPGAVAAVPDVPVEVGRSEPIVASARMYDGAAAAPAGELVADEVLGACTQPVTVTESGEALGRDCGLCAEVGGGVCAAKDAARNAAVAVASPI